MPLFGLPKGRGAYSETKNMPVKSMRFIGRYRVAKYPAKICFVFFGQSNYGKRDTQGKQPKSAIVCSALPKVGIG